MLTTQVDPALTVLKAARLKIADREHWCRGDYAQNAAGIATDPNYRDADRFCALGACRWAGGVRARYYHNDDVDRAIGFLGNEVPEGTSVATVNDVMGHAAVLALFDRAIAKLDPTYVPPAGEPGAGTQTDPPQQVTEKPDDADPNGEAVPF